eukprot:m.292112 g.292112  ORF g.292112 m.292112 type:complete len:58 (-) comp15834_c2_seq2:6355-6528(-)
MVFNSAQNKHTVAQNYRLIQARKTTHTYNLNGQKQQQLKATTTALQSAPQTHAWCAF